MAGSRGKTLPFRLLALVLYGKQPWMCRVIQDGGIRVQLRSTPLLHAFAIQSRDLMVQVKFLQDRGYIKQVRRTRGFLELLIQHSVGWNTTALLSAAPVETK
jgi:hypothetical protein